MVALKLAVADESGEDDAAVPSVTGLFTAPMPVRYTVIVDPEAAGVLLAFNEPS